MTKNKKKSASKKLPTLRSQVCGGFTSTEETCVTLNPQEWDVDIWTPWQKLELKQKRKQISSPFQKKGDL